jgi:hypothetical protein
MGPMKLGLLSYALRYFPRKGAHELFYTLGSMKTTVSFFIILCHVSMSREQSGTALREGTTMTTKYPPIVYIN